MWSYLDYANEKMTNVNIATQLIVDAYQDGYDMAFINKW